MQLCLTACTSVAHRTRFGIPERLVQSGAPAFVNKGMPLMSTLRGTAWVTMGDGGDLSTGMEDLFQSVICVRQ